MNAILTGRAAQREWIREAAEPDAIALAETYGIDLADICPGTRGAGIEVTTYHVELARAAHLQAQGRAV
jgi:hypothetical protein